MLFFSRWYLGISENTLIEVVKKRVKDVVSALKLKKISLFMNAFNCSD